jgi:hypothetical protein
MITFAVLVASIALAPSAAADSADNLRTAVTAVRAGACAPLQSDPLVEQAAKEVVDSTDVWLNRKGRVPPSDDPLPLMRDLGYSGEKAKQLQGAGVNDAAAIKGLLLQGYLDIPDCSFSKFGVSMVRNQFTNYYLAAVVLAA